MYEVFPLITSLQKKKKKKKINLEMKLQKTKTKTKKTGNKFVIDNSSKISLQLEKIL